jgi:hypothetical protein
VTITWAKRLAPIIIVQAFLWMTLAAFAFGPWEWPMREPMKLYGFVFAAHLALLAGYLCGAHRSPTDGTRTLDFKRVFAWSLAASLVVLPITGYAKTGQWIPDLVGAVTNPGAAYGESHAYLQQTTNPGSYLRILLAPLLVALVPIGVFFWSRLRRIERFGLVAVGLAVVLLSVSTGQRRDIADLFFIVCLVALGSHWAGVTRWSRRGATIGAVACSLAALAFVAYFIVSHVSRVGEQTAGYGYNPVTRAAPDPESPIVNAVPEVARPGYLGLMHYFTTGYYGLSLSLDREVRPMYGLGHSMFLTRNWERVTKDAGFEQRSLPVQISQKDGFRYPVQWCTAYPYFANDLGFVGTVLMLFAVGWMFALAWMDVLGGKSLGGLVAFTLIATLLFYLPATNRMLQDGEGVVAFYVWICVWLVSRARATAPKTVVQPT